MTSEKPLILCADDFAQDAAISRGILQLVEARRLSAVSCFSEGPAWHEYGPELNAHASELLVGLHFNLTEAFGHAEKPLPYWMLGSVARLLDPADLRTRLQRQIDAFAQIRGAPPDFIDGHQHVHAFPTIRSIVHELVEHTDEKRGIRVRNIHRLVGETDAPAKRLVIRTLANRGPRPDGADRHWMNSTFAGDYSLSADAQFGRLFANWLTSSDAGGMIMCHPGRADGSKHAVREKEWRFLAAREFGALLAEHRCHLATRQPSP